MTRKEEVKLKRWEWIMRQGVPLSKNPHNPRKIRRAFKRIKQFYLEYGSMGIALSFPIEEDPQLIPGKRYRWIIEELDEPLDGPVAP